MEQEQLTEFKIQLALPAPGFEEFRQYMDQRISTQETLLQRIAQELGLDKPKQQ
jgi:hypothetical protein